MNETKEDCLNEAIECIETAENMCPCCHSYFKNWNDQLDKIIGLCEKMKQDD